MAEKDKRSSASFVPFKPLDNLFEPTIQEKPVTGDSLQNLPLDDLHAFKDHPFRLYTEDKMAEMVESIQEHGVITPILVRPANDGNGYEIISGHNRVEACRRAGIEHIPATVRELDDDTAIIVMVDSNLRQREKLLPIEKAMAYKMKLEAIKRQGARTDLTSSQVGTKFRSDEMLAETMPDSRMQIQRYIRLNNLQPALLDMVDEKRISFTPAVELSYLTEEEQCNLIETIESEDCTPSLSQAQRMHKLSDEKKLTMDTIFEIMQEQKANQKEYVKIPVETFKKYFKKDMPPKKMEEITEKALARYAVFLQKQRQWER